MEPKNLLHHHIRWPAAASAEIMMLKKEIVRFEMRSLLAVSHKPVKYDLGHYRYCISPLRDMSIEGEDDPLVHT